MAALVSFLAVRLPLPGPLFVWRDGYPLSLHRLVKEVRAILSALGQDSSKYAGHSFLFGAATTAAQVGVPAHLIKMLGRRQSQAYLLYVRTHREELARISSLLC